MAACRSTSQSIAAYSSFVVDGAEVEHLSERGDGAFGRQGAGGGELRLRVDDAGDEQCEDEVAEAAGAAGEQGSECELADGGEHGGDVAVWEAAEAGEGVVGTYELLAAEDVAEGVDGGGGEAWRGWRGFAS